MQARVDEWIAAWNAHDSARAAQQMARDGLYDGPGQRMALHPYDLGAAMETMEVLFADYRFEAAPAIVTAGRAVVEWTMHATNTGPIKAGVAATGRALHVKGVDVIRDGDGGFAQISRYYDQKGMFEALGLQVIVEPHTQGRAVYGYSMQVSSGNMQRPGIVALTWIRARDEAERDRVRAHSSKIVQDFVAQPGFIGIITGFAGERGFTVTAWEDEAALTHALDQEHARAKQDFRTGELSPGVWTSVWQPLRLNRMWSRCQTCGQPNDVSDDARACVQCGATLPPRPTYW
jgi:heme-degrading monooxygenase HmoA